MGGNYSPLDERVDELRAAAEEGLSVTEAGERFGVSESSVRRAARRHGVKFKLGKPGPRIGHIDVVSREEIMAAELAELRRAASKVRKDDVHQERVTNAIEDALGRLDARPAEPIQAPPPDKTAHHRQLILLSDFHGGEIVDPEVLNGLNSYNWEIMERRVDEVIESMLSHKRNSPNLTGLDIAFLGDMCSGSNHYELAVSNEIGMAEQGVRMGLLMGQIVERLIPHYPNIRVLAVEGNHPRLTAKPAAKNPHENFDWVAAVFAKHYLAGQETVEFTVGRGSLRHTIAGLNGYFFHGDGIRSSMPGVPFGGLMRRVNVLQSQYRERIDFYAYGHFHTATIVQAGRIIGNGSLKGPDEWTQKNFGGGDPPAQWLLTFDEKASRMTDFRLVTPITGLPC